MLTTRPWYRATVAACVQCGATTLNVALNYVGACALRCSELVNVKKLAIVHVSDVVRTVQCIPLETRKC